MYALINSVSSLNCWVTLTKGVVNELFVWHGLRRGRFEGDIWPAPEGLSIPMASDAIIIGWGKHTIEDASKYAREYFSAE